jgi:hypothetical protein
MVVIYLLYFGECFLGLVFVTEYWSQCKVVCVCVSECYSITYCTRIHCFVMRMQCVGVGVTI